MSYILEALRKAERERSLGQVPTVGGLQNLPQPSRRRLWPWVLGIALLLNAGVVSLVYLFPRDGEAPLEELAAVPAPPSAEPAPAPAAPEPEPVPVPEVVVAEPPPEPVTGPDLVDQLEAEATLEAAPEVEVLEPAEAEAPPPTPAPIRESTRPASGDVAWLRDMPASFRQSLPPMKIDAHFYSENAERAFVMINLRRYRQGERSAEGPQIEAIETDGIVMNWQGQRFKYPLPR